MRYIILSVCSAFAKNTKCRISAPVINEINYFCQSRSHLTIRSDLCKKISTRLGHAWAPLTLYIIKWKPTTEIHVLTFYLYFETYFFCNYLLVMNYNREPRRDSQFTSSFFLTIPYLEFFGWKSNPDQNFGQEGMLQYMFIQASQKLKLKQKRTYY